MQTDFLNRLVEAKVEHPFIFWALLINLVYQITNATIRVFWG